MEEQQWLQVRGQAAELYEGYQVPRLFEPLAVQLLDSFPLRAGMRLLDVACGTGIVARLAAPCIAPSESFTGIDVDAEMIAVARARAAEEGLLIDFRRGDAAALPFGDAAFDGVCCQQGLQFFSKATRALQEMRRVLAPGGLLALSVFGAANRYHVALAEGLAKYVDQEAAKQSLAPFALADLQALKTLMHTGGFGSLDIHTTAVTRRVQPSQEWLVQDTAATPFGEAITEMDAVARAAMVRDIAGQLKDLWDADGFAVPTEVHLVYARR